ncbi:MAG TPA: prenyltransferase/squalene oxidase repeat-containing protein [Prolixibacteraceae bacterium]|nr:prenyltransferase/squalene oxidase repeat-containing protein [Prolixibacteraceae bacterium]
MTSDFSKQRRDELIALLKSEMHPDGYWEGQLSSSALGVAVSVTAFHFYDGGNLRVEIEKGVDWLVKNANSDGGFGDTPESQSNISTSLLCLAALHVNRKVTAFSVQVYENLVDYLRLNKIDISSGKMARNVLDFYQTDYTFSVPILAMCALCGIPEKDAFKPVPQLPFELALLPRSFYRFLKLNVVSYAIPALVAVGIAVFKQKKQGWQLRVIRQKAIKPSLRKLEALMPESGGFLEAIPLTAFVSLSLIKAGYRDNRVVDKGIEFLKRTQRADGSWPIDIDLSTWVTTLSIKALKNVADTCFSLEERKQIIFHLLEIQNQTVHPFNGTSPEGWGWTSFSGSVPDGDDTPGVILALMILADQSDSNVNRAIENGCDWLLKLQNSDGGFPTFSRGWGKLPFDQSSADLTGHALLALSKSVERLKYHTSEKKLKKYRKAVVRSTKFLLNHQQENGSWIPLWFGNQNHPDHHNRVYGTARVCSYLLEVEDHFLSGMKNRNEIKWMVERAQHYLVSVQNEDGSWGGDKDIAGTMEETSLAVTALQRSSFTENVEKGIGWLDRRYRSEGLTAAPIGLYFASLWYDEKLYPLTMYLETFVHEVAGRSV